MFRHTFIIVLSLAAVAVTLALVVSLFCALETGFGWVPFSASTWANVQVEGGRITVTRRTSPPRLTGEPVFMENLLRPVPRQFAGIAWSRNRISCRLEASLMLLTVLAIYPTIALIRGPWRRHRRRKRGLCLKCGYNLAGNVSGVCPECGEAM